MLSKIAIAKGTGLSLSTVKRFFLPTGNPTLKTAIKIAAYFNITLDVVNQLREREVKLYVKRQEEAAAQASERKHQEEEASSVSETPSETTKIMEEVS